MSTVYLIDGGTTRTYRARKATALREARNLSSQDDSIYQVWAYETLDHSQGMLQELMLNQGRWWFDKKRLTAFRRGLELKSWQE